jgi:hypothetical protein
MMPTDGNRAAGTVLLSINDETPLSIDAFWEGGRGQELRVQIALDRPALADIEGMSRERLAAYIDFFESLVNDLKESHLEMGS